MCGQYLLLPWIQLLKIDYTGRLYLRNAWKACEKVKGFTMKNSKGYIKVYHKCMKNIPISLHLN